MRKVFTGAPYISHDMRSKKQWCCSKICIQTVCRVRAEVTCRKGGFPRLAFTHPLMTPPLWNIFFIHGSMWRKNGQYLTVGTKFPASKYMFTPLTTSLSSSHGPIAPVNGKGRVPMKVMQMWKSSLYIWWDGLSNICFCLIAKTFCILEMVDQGVDSRVSHEGVPQCSFHP